MRPQEKKTTTQSLALFEETLRGKNYAPESIKAYMGDLTQFFGWLQTRRVDFDIPYRLTRMDIVEFINHLASRKTTSGTRQRKLASIGASSNSSKTTRLSLAIPLTRLKALSGKSGTRQSF
jgi:site-specific recombinase XerD